MEFKRKRIRGQTQKTYKEWQSECGHYRVCWRNETPSLGSARYYATVRCDRGGGCEFWDFAADRRPYRTLKAASTEPGSRSPTRSSAANQQPAASSAAVRLSGHC